MNIILRETRKRKGFHNEVTARLSLRTKRSASESDIRGDFRGCKIDDTFAREFVNRLTHG